MKTEEFESRIDGIIGRERVRLAKEAGERMLKLHNELIGLPGEVGKTLAKYGIELKKAFELREILGVERVLEIMESGGLIHSGMRVSKYGGGGDTTLGRVLEEMGDQDEFFSTSASVLKDTKMKVTILVEPIIEEE